MTRGRPRSSRRIFDPLSDAGEDNWENVRLLRGVASSIENDYMLGMNSTRIVVGCEEEPSSDSSS